jgi:predicted aminopeptidase
MKYVFLFLCSGCTGASYLAQAIAGQVEILDHRRPLKNVIADEKTPAYVRELLAEVPRLKAYAAEQGLRATHNYERYVDLKRPAAVWVVSASEPFAFHAQTWWFPIVGSVPYLGWFHLADAQRFALSLQQQGLDVSLRTAAAYSTLGFFDDPILSSMLSTEPDAIGDLANTLFHESLHATIYVRGRTDVSEGLASFVGDRMARDYLQKTRRPEILAAYDAAMRRGKARLARLKQLRSDLERLYESHGPDMAAEKGRLIMQAKQELHWKRVLNNATLAEIGRYASHEDEMQALFDSVGHDWHRFLARARELYGSQ